MTTQAIGRSGGTQGLHELLRTRTSGLHTEAERHEFQSDLVQGRADVGAYASYLQQMLHVHRALEAGLHRCAVDGCISPFLHSRLDRSTDLEEDLRTLGASIDVKPLEEAQRFGATAASASPESLLGALYVLEGSTNGGRFIAGAIRRAYGASGADATRYLDPYGDEQKKMWTGFCDTLGALDLDQEERERVVLGAEWMFRTIIRLFDDLTADSD